MHLTGQRLAKSIGPLFDNVAIEPCLLHGDLWSGNISSDKNGEPVILDPACYCKFNVPHASYIYNYMLGFKKFPSTMQVSVRLNQISLKLKRIQEILGVDKSKLK